MGDMERQLLLFATLEEAEAIAEEKRSQVRDKVVRLLQDGVRERREASEDEACRLAGCGRLQ